MFGATPSGHDFLEMWLRKSVHAGSVKGLSHANLRGPPRKGFSVYSFIYQNLYKRFSKGTRIMKGNPSIILAKRSDLSNEEALH
jgi:hypothetical protein